MYIYMYMKSVQQCRHCISPYACTELGASAWLIRNWESVDESSNWTLQQQLCSSVTTQINTGTRPTRPFGIYGVVRTMRSSWAQTKGTKICLTFQARNFDMVSSLDSTEILLTHAPKRLFIWISTVCCLGKLWSNDIWPCLDWFV